KVGTRRTIACTVVAATLIALAWTRLVDAAPANADAMLKELLATTPPSFSLGKGPTTRLGTQGQRVTAAIRAALGLDASHVPVHVMTSQALTRSYGKVGGSAMRYRIALEGFHFQGHVFVKDGLMGISDQTLTHEVLHALSRRFTTEAGARGYYNLTEGMTDFF